LYRANALVRPVVDPATCGIMACSSEVMGPDSFASTEMVPVSAATIRSVTDVDSAYTVPAAAMTRRSAA
jgi:hypothetical protein